MLYGAPPARRRDALRNRAAIVEAASTVLSGPGSAALMPETARLAGVAQATLYRHFPDRQALAAAVIEHHLTRLAARAASTLEHPETLRPLVRDALHRQVVMRPLVLRAQRLEDDTRLRYQRRLITAFTAPLHHAQAGGFVRADAVPGDLLLLVLMLQGVPDATAAHRSVELLLDGLFAPPDRGHCGRA
ncbi:TetR/AcrR family transcriptional regulator [Actinoplanes sp. TFC3]|uniref:TetR/AcrR family transcriptional regulator n=1 Tax=Actinoplanes sp. TFC3 TaxID=1710355 RepID=UPI000836F9E6|nr:TetR/AcrR family transcriptional regulator [Actinoplanes sp. TFC3]